MNTSTPKIQVTTDYKKFKTIHGNRILNQQNLLKLTKSVAAKNLLEFQPIIVNQNMEVIDGQHRLKIAADNKFPIYYMVVKDAYLKDIHRLNSARKDWSNLDYIKSYAKQGDINYKKLLSFVEEYNLRIGIALVFLINARHGADYLRLKSGEFILKNESIELGHKRVAFYKQVIPFFEDGYLARTENIIYALNKIMADGYMEILLENLPKVGEKLKHKISKVEYLRDFERVANWGKKTRLIRLF